MQKQGTNTEHPAMRRYSDLIINALRDHAAFLLASAMAAEAAGSGPAGDALRARLPQPLPAPAQAQASSTKTKTSAGDHHAW